MQSILIEVSLGSDEYMLEESSQMFSELNDVEDLHDSISLFEWVKISWQIRAVAIASQPRGHVGGRQYDHIRRNGANPVVEHREAPLDNGICFFLSRLFCWVFHVIDIVFGAFVIQQVVGEAIAEDENDGDRDAV